MTMCISYVITVVPFLRGTQTRYSD